MVPGFALWSEQEQRYVLRFYPAIEMTGDVVEDTQRIHSQLESVIRAVSGSVAVDSPALEDAAPRRTPDLLKRVGPTATSASRLSSRLVLARG